MIEKEERDGERNVQTDGECTLKKARNEGEIKRDDMKINPVFVSFLIPSAFVARKVLWREEMTTTSNEQKRSNVVLM
jgi:hypothetical protein